MGPGGKTLFTAFPPRPTDGRTDRPLIVPILTLPLHPHDFRPRGAVTTEGLEENLQQPLNLVALTIPKIMHHKQVLHL